ncbi:type 1 glutamine amidotransferase domain-containing protein [Kaistella palustris]|uniref:type 1 glutamine amidotransferase domain-containing protein n=1 Tax=Kaistella palustris TaxID=493376 RepID=UPI0004162285|nr:type 1 glutamine amidotransferase domain-containing protein [Kaistella palustris]
MKKVLMILTSHKELENTDSTTGLWIGEFTDPYYEFIDKGYQVTLASPKGGKPPIDPMSAMTENITSSNRRFQDDVMAQDALNHTHKLEEVAAADFDAVFYPGGHGPLFDLAYNEKSGQLIIDFLQSGKPVAAVCHGPAALLKAVEMDPSMFTGKNVTGFSNMEEKLAMRANNIPYQLEDRLKETGFIYHTALLPLGPHVETDGLLITGQNPLSAGPTAEALIKHLQ